MKKLKPLFLLLLQCAVVTLVVAVATGPCFALREIAVVGREEAKEWGIDVRVSPAGADAVRVELEFKPEGKLKDFVEVELKMTESDGLLLLSTALNERRTPSGSVVVALTVNRAKMEGMTLSVVLRSPGEAGDHTCELRMKEYMELEEKVQ